MGSGADEGTTKMNQTNKTKNRKSIFSRFRCFVRCLFDPLILLYYGWKPDLRITLQWKDIKTGLKFNQKEAINFCEEWDIKKDT